MDSEMYTYASTDVYETIKDELDCSICKDILGFPKSLSCGHVFCLACLDKMAKTLKSSDLSCPTCRRSTPLPHNGVRDLPTSYRLSSLIDKLKKQEEAAPRVCSMVCELHNKKIELFCEDCDEGACTACLLGKHRGHKYAGVEEKIGDWTNSLRLIIPTSNKALEEALEAAEKMKKEKELVSHNQEKVHKEIQLCFFKLQDSITEQEKLLCEAVDKYYEANLAKLEDMLTKVEMQSLSISQSLAQVISTIEKQQTASLICTKKIINSLTEQHATVSQLAETAEKLDLSCRFLSFVENKSLQSQLAEVGTLNECVTINEPERGHVPAFKVKQKILMQRRASKLQFESNSSESENEEQSVDGNPQIQVNEDALYDEVFLKPPLPSPRPPIRRAVSPCPYNVYDECVNQVNKSAYDNSYRSLSMILQPVKVINQSVLANLKQPIQPWGVGISPNNNIYITDCGNCCVLVLTFDGRLSKLIGTRGTGRGQFSMPVDVALDEKCNVYVADRQNGSVQKFNENGRIKLRFKQGEPPNNMKQPNGLAVFRARVYVSDRMAGKILVFDQEGVAMTSISPMHPVGGQPFQPAGLAVHPKFEKIYVADRCNHQVLVFNNDGELVHTIGQKGQGPGQLSFPIGLAITPDLQLLVSETENNRVSSFNCETGLFIKSFGTAGEMEGMFINPRHLAINKHGEAFIADEKNHRVQVFEVVQSIYTDTYHLGEPIYNN